MLQIIDAVSIRRRNNLRRLRNPTLDLSKVPVAPIRAILCRFEKHRLRCDGNRKNAADGCCSRAAVNDRGGCGKPRPTYSCKLFTVICLRHEPWVSASSPYSSQAANKRRRARIHITERLAGPGKEFRHLTFAGEPLASRPGQADRMPDGGRVEAGR